MIRIILIIAHLIGYATIYGQTTISVHTNFNGFHCDGKTGICDIGSQNNRSQSNTAIVLNDNNTITFTIDREKLSMAEQQNIIGIHPNQINSKQDYYFKIPFTYILPEHLKQSLQDTRANLSIAKGSYLIKMSQQFYTIIFKLN
ncbi:hypothetical protein G5B37_01805 [Rasiella rasia]|uniref:Uncharacterized protein n=1 Tax=Rasiella rasia TaxID=2744027 RepID=A0A6G6GIL2_9FLAO|nr:hypothetical protein [Rasiella rasia]QIE58340.1 hypothetical protein G5B37_01805 [Rasiella rasia]